MKTLFACGVTLLLSSGIDAQVRGRSFAPVLPSPSRPPLVSSGASSRPLGGVALPTFPATPIPRKGAGRRPAARIPRYIGPVYYIPNAFDTNYDYSPEPPPEAPVQPRRVFRAQPQSRLEDNGLTQTRQAEAEPPPENYYLIAYKDHTIYPALTYWVEGDTLHYLTTGKTANQASLAFIDIEQTTRLNSDHSVPFTVPAR